MNLFKKLKIVDYVIIFVIILLVVIGSLAVFKKKNFANLPIEKEAIIHFDVFFRGITLTSDSAPFKKGENAFITIRNVPYTKLKVVATIGQPRMAVLPAKNEKGYIFAEDVSTPNLYDFIVRLEDKAKKTPDGFVAGGNKIKMGIPVVIEGETYKYSGTISNVYEVTETNEVQETQEK